MKIYTLYAKETEQYPMENIIFIKEGFSWGAAVFNFFMAFYNKMWALGIALLLINILLSILGGNNYIYPELAQALYVGFFLFVGCNYNDWYRHNLEKRGYSYCGVASGKNVEDALSSFISEMLQSNSFVSS